MTRMLVLAMTLALTACGDSAVLTGPQAQSAVAQAQARLESTGELQFTGVGEGVAMPIVFLDDSRVTEDPRAVLRRIAPADIERIEVIKGCGAAGYAGADASSGMIRIFTKAFEGELPELEFNEELVYECKDRHGTRPGWLQKAQQRHVRN